MPKDLGITRIRGLRKVVVECGTCILIMPLFEGVTQPREIVKILVYNIYSHHTRR
jgi:hypothetical protein